MHARSRERRGLVSRMSMLRLHRDAVLTVLGLHALAEAKVASHANRAAAVPVAGTWLATSACSWTLWLRGLAHRVLRCY